jgi:Mg-chelatase subunit ChlD
MAGVKLEKAKEAALAFLASLRLPDDQMGVVGFSRSATVASQLTSDAAALTAAIAGLQPSPGTRIDTGLEAATMVLATRSRQPGRVAAVVVLTDGVQEDMPELALDAADRLRSDGAVLYVVGLGEDVDVAFLGELAQRPDSLFLSPDPAELAGVYEEIARLIPCPGDLYWPDR